ncbi:MAG TPA: valine--tRNA ligase, partial [Fimbriimonadaceae bacterium]|nr:valine--tRNA ligase [Fimbriimonadaceae bacterium]
VEKQLRKQGTSGAQLGREKFIERVWEWRKESGDTIINQFRRLGLAFDWSRLRFTLDDQYADAVLRVFVEWFDRGLIFRGKRVVNWDPVLKTSVSDIETERRLVKGKLYHIRYPFKDGSGSVTIATTRPETMLADVAVAVHPSDARYKDLVGKTLILPLMGREIPLIADIYPDPEFGTGAVKITPAHDPNDFLVGQRHNLPMPVLLDESARVTAEGGPYAGLDRYEARKRIVEDLEAGGFLEKIDDHEIPIIVSERSGEPIEPLLSEQWFADQRKLAQPGVDAVRAGKIKFVPERYEQIYLDWSENVHEWTLSRQLWWGHRIPVFYDAEGGAYAALSWEEAQAKAGEKEIVRQEEDVLDTWFSSGLWPFATLGWPEETPDLDRHYPTSVLVTDRNIIYLWVARMIMMGLDFMGEVPFNEVYIYATVLTEDGRRMSKSLGTGVDPMDVIEKIGADPLRYTLMSQCGYNQDIRYSERRTEEARNFCNKIWNATRFVLMNVEAVPARPEQLEDTDRWLLSRLYRTEESVRTAFDSYDIQAACQALYRFFWSELCDWYIEVSKVRLTSSEQRAAPQWVLLTAIEAFVKMMHPVMPHITEEIYSHLPLPKESQYLMGSSWPQLPEEFHQPEIEARVERLFEVTRELRALRAALEVTPRATIAEAYYVGDLAGGEALVASQAWVERLVAGKPEGKSMGSTVSGIDLYLPTEGLVDTEKLLPRLEKEQEKLESEIAKLDQRLSNSMFVERAKPEVVEKERENLEELRAKLQKVQERRKLFSSV